MKKIPFLDLYSQYESIQKELDAAIQQTIKESSFIKGKSVETFEKNFASINNMKYCTSCANGTDALYVAMKSLKIKPGQEVITTALSWVSTSETITQAGGEIVFCDIKPESYCIDVSLIESLINEKTVGIIPVHIYGQPCEMKTIMYLAEKYKLWVVEDCAQAHLAEYQEKNVGSFGYASTFSFYPSKNLGAMGDAGAILTNQIDANNWMHSFTTHGRKNIHEMEGINSRMDGLQAAILNVKLKHLKNWTDKRIKAAEFYNQNLNEVGDLKLPIKEENTLHVYHLYTLRTKYRDELKNFLNKNGISTTINYPVPLPFLKCYEHINHKDEDFPIAKDTCKSIVAIPLFPEIKKTDQEYIIEKIKSFFKNL